ncbi:uncharacterized protein [Nothobranchius furzeri]|uniref:uncharacterized protein isoform X2 n=1 Tax=Nothobranchius furzeri TaxID=105023 RepID=UPI003904AC8A
MRLLLAVSLILLFLWLQKAQRSSTSGNVCEAVSLSEAVVSVLLSPLSLYTWMTSTLLRFVVSLPSLVLGALHQSLLLILTVPWCVAMILISLFLTCLHVVLYLLHMALVVGVVAISTLMLHKKSDRDAVKQNEVKTTFHQMRVEDFSRNTNMRLSHKEFRLHWITHARLSLSDAAAQCEGTQSHAGITFSNRTALNLNQRLDEQPISVPRRDP